MIPWGEFAKQEPELASFGAERLRAVPAYLATVRRDGTPRVHPVTPIFTADGLYLFMEPTSPKRQDLLQQPWYALHCGVQDHHGTGGEYFVRGHGFEIDDPAIRALVEDASGYDPPERYVVFELKLVEARCHGYGDVPMPANQRWRAAG